jgi:hypothetical protein
MSQQTINLTRVGSKKEYSVFNGLTAADASNNNNKTTMDHPTRQLLPGNITKKKKKKVITNRAIVPKIFALGMQ